jgi:hypothetical protein
LGTQLSSALRIVSKPISSITPEQTREARARAWRFVFDCWEQKKAASKDGGESEAKHDNNEGGPAMT